jgi:hypothetical protein
VPLLPSSKGSRHPRLVMRLLCSCALAAMLLTCGFELSIRGDRPIPCWRRPHVSQRNRRVPAKLSDFNDLEINSFQTSNGVKLSYWEAGHGTPLVFLPDGRLTEPNTSTWCTCCANSTTYTFLSLAIGDYCNGLIVDYRNRISRFATDLKEFTDHLGLASADFCSHSMGSAIL